jgi:Fcf2 pre-rRNA processing
MIGFVFMNSLFCSLPRFYKNADKVGKVLHVGTVIEGPSEYFSSRLSNKERKRTIVEEILGDKTLKDYSKRKFSEIQVERSSKKKMYKTKKGKK